MAKTKFPEEKGDFKPRTFGPKNPYQSPEGGGGFSFKGLGIITFILGVLLLPLTYASAISFLKEFSLVKKELQADFWAGAVCFLIIHLFVWVPEGLFKKGQDAAGVIFRFIKPAANILPYLVPIYSALIFALYRISLLFADVPWSLELSVFLLGWTYLLHLVLSAKSLRPEEGGMLNGNYIFGFQVIFIISLLVLVLFLSLIFDRLSLVNYFNNAYRLSHEIYISAFKQLFVN